MEGNRGGDHDSLEDGAGAAVTAVASFDDMGLEEALLRGIYSFGFERPSAIQQRAIVPLAGGGDMVAQAQSGTGKTGAFVIGTLQRIDFAERCCQAILLSPTRELAAQTEFVVSHMGEYVRRGNPFVAMFVGGTPWQEDVRRIRQGVLVAVGTPGRMLDHIRRGTLRVDKVTVCVLDEADEMLSQGFQQQVYDIFQYLPRDVQLALFSATMPQCVVDLTRNFMRGDALRILVEAEKLTLEGIRQFYVAVEEGWKLETLLDLYESVSIGQSVVFCNTRQRVAWLAGEMNDRNHTVSCMYAEMSKPERERVMATFRSGSSRVLLSTDLLARGIDVQHVSFVVNYELPPSKECYLHRIGRAGRFGRRGVAINLVSPRDVGTLEGLQRHYGVTIEELPMNFASHLG